MKRWQASDGPLPVVTVSVDEKPGLQAIANTAADLSPVAGKHPETARDHEYKTIGNLFDFGRAGLA